MKGVKYLELAVANVNYYAMTYLPNCPKGGVIELRVVSNARGAELEEVWKWCDVLCLPTLSENFGRVVAEALERGKQVITTDGVPAWREYFEQHPDAGMYLTGFRDSTESVRIKRLADALKIFVG